MAENQNECEKAKKRAINLGLNISNLRPQLFFNGVD